MASPDPPVQKKLKAKKTIPTSCRKQIHILHKLGNTEPLKAVNKNNIYGGNQQLNTEVMHRKSENSDMKCFFLDPRRKTILTQENETFPQNLAVSLKRVKNNSKMNFVNERVVDPNNRPAETENSCKKLFIQDSSDSQQTSCGSEYKTKKKRFSFEQAKVDLSLKPSSSPSGSLNDLIDKSAYILGNHVEKAFNSIGNGRENNQVGPQLEVTSQSESHVSQQSEATSVKSSHTHLTANKTSDLKRSVQAKKSTSDFLKTQECNQTDHSRTSECENTVSTWHSSFDTNSSSSKKRVLSGNKENIKRMKTSHEINENTCIVEKESSLFEQVKCLIQQEVCTINYKIFDHKLKELNERVDKTQCRKRHEAIAIELLKKISKLDRCIKAALTSQRIGLESKIPAQNMACKQVTNSKTVILNKNQGAETRSPSTKLTPLNNKSSEPSEISANEAKQKNLTSDCVEVVSESNNADVMLISEESGDLQAPPTRTTDAEKMVLADSSDSLGSETNSKASREKTKHEDMVIDLTEEASLNSKTATSLEVVELPVATNVNLKEKNLVAQDSTQVLESFEHLPSLPETPHHSVPTGSNDSPPPQKFELRLKRVLKPRGIALTWNTSHINPRCAPVESYHLYICHDSNKNKSKTAWKKVGEIKALPLPMACSLSQFLSSGTYYFTLQARDIYGRFGPFCDIKYIHGLPEDNIKESQVLPT
ncbi:activating transcription factor 7-interacting protein 2 [Trichosurus vulpecula]|uniref:activating transcription factor 7-interacting protein 2 n=1 Tax=Trichosurus vulpecula TaxID=9337 RepID=UPI00186B17E9|nr:activating transcription factor 7-interacting protein 2 [Trichosurus vulpecula]XP_036594717.1 activating transcription factor 7-interacting protein 2 [Trichosurus vulpecula]XP_036594718.1 activating transcription factor 7-interacting protein 2 [Trichosurus vulpecula]